MPRRIVDVIVTVGTTRLGTLGLAVGMAALLTAIAAVATGIVGALFGLGPASPGLAAFFLLNALGVLAGAITAAVEVFELVDAWRDRDYLRALREMRPSRLLMAQQHIRQAAFRILAALGSGAVCAALASAALVAIRARPGADVSWFSIVSVGIFVWITTMRAVMALLDRRDRKIVVRMAEADALAEEAGGVVSG